MTGFTYSIINKEPKHHWRWKTSFPRRSRGFPLLGERGGGGKITEGHDRLPGLCTQPGRLPQSSLTNFSKSSTHVGSPAKPWQQANQPSPPASQQILYELQHQCRGRFWLWGAHAVSASTPPPPPFFFLNYEGTLWKSAPISHLNGC